MKELVLGIIDGPPGKGIRGPQIFLVQYSKWLGSKSVKGAVICGSRRRLVKSFNIGNSSGIKNTIENESFGPIKYLPSMVRSFLYVFLSFIELLRLNRKYRFSILHTQDTLYAGMAAVAAAKILHIPAILSARGINTNVLELKIRPKVIARLYRAFYLRMQKELMKRSAGVFCVGEYTKSRLPNVGRKVTIKSAVNLALFQESPGKPREVYEELGIPAFAFVFGYIGSLTVVKRVHLILESFQHILPEIPSSALAYLAIVGDGAERGKLERLTKELEIEQYVRFTGFRTDVARLLGAIDVFVLLSESEGLPHSVIEAMAAGKAIIASDIPSIREVVNHNEEAILVDPHNNEELKQAMLALYEQPELRIRLSKQARRKANLYDINRVYSQILERYVEVI